MSSNISRLDLESLCVITTRDEDGRHFTAVHCAPVLSSLEHLGLIDINRPVHPQTGMQYSEDHWSVIVSPLGLQAIDAYCRGMKDAGDSIKDNGDAGIPDGGWDNWCIQGIGGDAMCRLLGEPPEVSQNLWSRRMLLLLQCYSHGGDVTSEMLSELFN